MTTETPTDIAERREETTLDEVYRRLLEGVYYDDHDWASGPALRCVCEAVTELETLRAKVAAMEGVQGKAVEALKSLERAATIVSRYGAQTGSQWGTMTSALITARAALAHTTETLK